MASRRSLILLLLSLLPTSVHGQMTANVYERVLLLRIRGSGPIQEFGTAFTVDVDGRQYLITAKHLVAKLAASDTIEYGRADHWVSLRVRVLLCDDPTDIAVLIPPYQITTAFPFPVDTTKIFYGQDVYLLGFPLGITLNGTIGNGNLPMPFIKRGTFSGTITKDAIKHSILIMLDGYTNPGFSGSPIVYRNPFSQSRDYKLLGVATGFQPEVTSVMKKHTIKSRDEASAAAKEQPWRIEINSDGSMFEYLETGNYVALNSGIVRGFAIFPAIELIEKHPVGPKSDVTKIDFPDDK